MKRAIFDVIFFISILIFPWWIPFALAFVGIFVFPHFYEFIAGGVLIYVLYAVPGSGLFSSPVWFPFILSLVYIVIQLLRQHIILYKHEISY
jgi:hypothetical protein